jgi:putative transposase
VIALLEAVVGALGSAFRSRASLVAENLALRQQLAVLKVGRRPRLRPIDRAFWVVLSRMWSRWIDVLAIVKPATVIAWHRCGYARYWAYKSRRRGRPPVAPEVIELIVRMARENPTWSRRRIVAELAKLGHDISKDSAAKYMPGPAKRPSRPPSTTWGTFVRLHLAGAIAVDFLTVPLATCRTLYVFVVLSLERRLLLHVNVTAHPYAAWAAQQMVEAMGPEVQAVRLIRDRDGIYGRTFDERVGRLGLETVRIAPRSPWQNGFAERLVGTLRRELLDHVIVLGERHLLRLVREHARYYNEDRPHMSLAGDAPVRRPVQPPALGRVVALPRVGGLHHRYARAAGSASNEIFASTGLCSAESAGQIVTPRPSLEEPASFPSPARARSRRRERGSSAADQSTRGPASARPKCPQHHV